MNNYYVIGTIVSTHALKGEVKIYSTTDFQDERYKIGNTLYIEKENKRIPVKIKSHRVHKGYDLLSFEGLEDINAVDPYLKCKILIDEDHLHDLEDEEFYYHQLKDCEVYHENQLIGKVFDINNYGASDLLFIHDQDNKEIIIPFVDDFIVDVDIENKRIDINVIEGLLNHED